MGVLKGYNGAVKFGADTVAEVVSFSITETAGTIANNTMGSGNWNKNLPGRKGWSGQVEVQYDPQDAGQTAPDVGDTVACEFLPEGDTTGLERRSGSAIITEVGLQAQGDDDSLVRQTFSLTGDGALTKDTIPV